MTTDLNRQMLTSWLDAQKTMTDKAIDAHAMLQRNTEAALQLGKFQIELARDMQQNLGKAWIDAAFPAKAS